VTLAELPSSVLAGSGRSRWRLSVEEYEHLTAVAAFPPDLRCELIEGEIVEMVSMLGPHADATRRLQRAFSRLFDDDWTVASQVPIRLARSMPEPDVWAARGGLDRYARRHPDAAEVVLVVEVADTSLGFDRTVKLPLYAEAGVPEVCIVSLPDDRIERSTEPDAVARTYRTMTVHRRGDTVDTPAGALAVDDLLPPPA
jgi:Uma2 family endonuclease